jgi:hypothetical protein
MIIIIIINGTTARVGSWPLLQVFVMVKYLRCGVISPTNDNNNNNKL